jgi:hypothetical protein
VGGRASPAWERNNLTVIRPPFQMRYAGQITASIRLHKKCADSLSRVLKAIWLASGGNRLTIDEWGVSDFGGSYNYRLKRNSNTLSMHAYGCAIDLAPTRFPMGQSSKRFVPAVVKAFADEGWINLKNDPMHFQAARLS